MGLWGHLGAVPRVQGLLRVSGALLVQDVAIGDKRCSINHPENSFWSAEFSSTCASHLHCIHPYACLGEWGKLVFSFHLFLLIIQNQFVDLAFEWFLKEMISFTKGPQWDLYVPRWIFFTDGLLWMFFTDVS